MVSSKSKTPEKRTKGKVIAAPIDVPADSLDSNDEDSDNGGVDEAGMERLMKALGDEGLDEFDQAQLGSLGGDDESDSEGEDENGSDEEDVEGLDQENDSEEDEEEEQEADEDDVKDDEGDGEEEDVALEDVEDVDDDVVPRQKIEIDNHVRVVPLPRGYYHSYISPHRLLSLAYANPYSWTPHFHGQRHSFCRIQKP